MYQVLYSERTRSAEIPKLDPAVRSIIVQAIETKLMTVPEAFGKPLRYTLRLLRVLRVGDWRVVYQLLGEIVYIVTIRHRKQGYADLK
jgi:mRNA interferase RelE/StbE